MTTEIKDVGILLEEKGIMDTLLLICKGPGKASKAEIGHMHADVAESILHLWEDWATSARKGEVREAINAIRAGDRPADISTCCNSAEHEAKVRADPKERLAAARAEVAAKIAAGFVCDLDVLTRRERAKIKRIIIKHCAIGTAIYW